MSTGCWTWKARWLWLISLAPGLCPSRQLPAASRAPDPQTWSTSRSWENVTAASGRQAGCCPSLGALAWASPRGGHLHSHAGTQATLTGSKGPGQGRPAALWVPSPRKVILGRGGQAGTVTPTLLKAWPRREGPGREAGGHVPASSTSWFSARWALPSPGPCSTALRLRLLWGGHQPGLSCSGPSCPQPAPVCYEAADVAPAHPSPGPPGSAGAGVSGEAQR